MAPTRRTLPFVLTGLFALWLIVPAAPVSPRLKGPGTGSRGGVVFSVPMEAKFVAITFDDGPSPSLTPAVLDILRQHSARCTFFPIGREVQKYPEVARQVVAEGHEIGCHTFSHVYFRSPAVARLESEFDTCEKLFPETLGVRPTLFRFPGLTYDTTMVQAAGKRGYTVISCSLDAYDWRIKDAKQLAQRVTSLIRPGDIVLMHDGNWLNLPRAKEALGLIFDSLQQQGYICITVSELISFGLAEQGRDQGPE